MAKPARPDYAGVRVGRHELDEMLAERDQAHADVRRFSIAQTDAWGIKSPRGVKHITWTKHIAPSPARRSEVCAAKSSTREGDAAAEKLTRRRASSPPSPRPFSSATCKPHDMREQVSTISSRCPGSGSACSS